VIPMCCLFSTTSLLRDIYCIYILLLP